MCVLPPCLASLWNCHTEGTSSPQLTRDLNNSVCLPVDGHGDRHVDGGGHEGVGRRVEERHQDGICAPLVDLKVKILRN